MKFFADRLSGGNFSKFAQRFLSPSPLSSPTRFLFSHAFAVATLMFSLFALKASAGVWEQWQQEKDLTPETLMEKFADFKFELAAQAQTPEQFLSRRRGDCDDFARVVSSLLNDRGYHTKVVAVMMERETHVVCYVAEAGGYLDFNHRTWRRAVASSDGSLDDIAQKVSAEFGTKWRMASEIQFQGAKSVYVNSTFYRAPALVPVVTAAVVSQTAVSVAAK